METIRVMPSDERAEELDRLSQLIGMTANSELFPGLDEEAWKVITDEIDKLTIKYFSETED